MSRIVESTDVEVPVRVAYDQWTQFEEFPRFMDGVKSVEQLNDTTLAWNAEINGVDRSWRAEISEQEPDTVVAWHSTSGAKNDGRVSFEPIDGIADARHARARGRAGRRGREGGRRTRLRPASGRGRPSTLQGVHRIARHANGRLARRGRERPEGGRGPLTPDARLMQGRGLARTDDRDVVFATLRVWLLYHWGSGSHTYRFSRRLRRLCGLAPSLA